MSEDKPIPHMTNLYPLIKEINNLKDVLELLRNNDVPRDILVTKLMEFGELFKKESSANRTIGSLSRYNIVFLYDDKVAISELSRDFLDNKINYPDYILRCLSSNLEWSYFIPDIYELVSQNNHFSKSKLIDSLGLLGYDISKRDNVNRYMIEILPVLDLCGVIDYQKNSINIGKRTKIEISSYSNSIQKELLNLLLMADRRKINKTTFRRLYNTTIKAYLPLREHRTAVEKVQKEIEEIRKQVIRQSSIKETVKVKSEWRLSDPLWTWQQDYLDKWLRNRQGIAKVVTGAGKTRLALAIMEKLNIQYPNLKVTIVVPTIVLLEQWYDSIIDELNISPNDISLRGGGHDVWDQERPIRIIVINSAIKDNYLKKDTSDIENHLLIVDECHRVGSKEFRRIFDVKRDFNLGLSATPEREGDNSFDEILSKELGPIIGSYTYSDGLRDGIIPPFDIINYGVLLNKHEMVQYNQVTKEISNAIKNLKSRYPMLNNSSYGFEATIYKIQKDNPNDPDVYTYLQKTKERKQEIIYPAENRRRIVKQILESVLGQSNPQEIFDEQSPLRSLSKDDQVILFHELIEEVNRLFLEIDSNMVSIYHSKLPASLNRIGLSLYRGGQTKILLSVRALIEGVNVPSTNIGIIMASSSSQTQRIQSIGRVLRKAKGKERTRLIVVYVKDTTDERVYKKGIDWDSIIGKNSVQYRIWSKFGEVESNGIMEEKDENSDIEDISMLNIGDVFPGLYAGKAYSFDSKGKVFIKTSEGRTYLDKDCSSLWKNFRVFKPTGGKFLIDENGFILIKSEDKNGGLKTYYLGSKDDYIK